MGKKAVLVASHGEFAKYALESVEMIVGKQENCDYCSVKVDDTLDVIKKEIRQKINKLDTSSGLVILVDIFGGSPSNVASQELLTNENVLVISGLNLPLLIDCFLNQDKSIEDLEARLEATYEEGFVNINRKLKESEGKANEYQDL